MEGKIKSAVKEGKKWETINNTCVFEFINNNSFLNKLGKRNK